MKAVSVVAAVAGTGLALVVLRLLRARRRRHEVIVLDGGCGLELKLRKSQGKPVAYDLLLFSTAALIETPRAILDLHRDYIRAGCTVLTTASCGSVASTRRLVAS